MSATKTKGRKSAKSLAKRAVAKSDSPKRRVVGRSDSSSTTKASSSPTNTRQPAANSALALKVNFRQFSCGENTVNLGFSADRDSLSVERADEYLCGHRLRVDVVQVPADVSPDAAYLFPDCEYRFEAVVDVKGFKVTPKLINAGLAIPVGSVDLGHLHEFVKKPGWIIIRGIEGEAAPDSGDDGDRPLLDSDDDSDFGTDDDADIDV